MARMATLLAALAALVALTGCQYHGSLGIDRETSRLAWSSELHPVRGSLIVRNGADCNEVEK